ncbi:Box C/D snoRNA protein 1 [Choanephora cucurbitarum]|uniref:Box C/D snoRNA protein 1 n=1 Tax=Choanephora cucurbitarum TaxID=101091 RepID=A0A1C7NM42_9FUNG|nr:Box C/D snoRNA protein 1 [Choanephora cucurbitarum]
MSTTLTGQDESGITIVAASIQDDLSARMKDDIPPMTEEEARQAKLCQLCQLRDWIYTCPRCLIHTCSVECVKQHKQNSTCSGVRDKTSYVSLQKYTESNMMSDYTYLEDVSRQTDNFTRSRMEVSRDLKSKNAESRARALAKSANQAGIHFSYLPIGMSRSKLNQTNYSKNHKQIFWSIEVNFCRNNKRERYLEHSYPSNKPFYAFFENLLLSENPQGRGSYATIRHQLSDFIDAGIDQFIVALKKEKAPRGHFVNVTSVLDALFRDVLKDEQIIEFPIFYIWLKQDEQPSEVVVLEDKKQPLIIPLRDEATSDEQQETPLDQAISNEQQKTSSNQAESIEQTIEQGNEEENLFTETEKPSEEVVE